MLAPKEYGKVGLVQLCILLAGTFVLLMAAPIWMAWRWWFERLAQRRSCLLAPKEYFYREFLLTGLIPGAYRLEFEQTKGWDWYEWALSQSTTHASTVLSLAMGITSPRRDNSV